MSLILRSLFKRYIGVDKPVLQITTEPTDFPGKRFPPWELELEDADHLRIDEQPFEKKDYE